MYFNSTLVRLKQTPHQHSKKSYQHFNSTLVRLKPEYRTLIGQSLNIFQFYISTIKAL